MLRRAPAIAAVATRPRCSQPARPTGAAAPSEPAGRRPESRPAAAAAAGCIKADFVVRDAAFGRGLFAEHGLEPGSIITRYDGERRAVTDPGLSNLSKSHMIRIPQSSTIIDGRPLARAPRPETGENTRPGGSLQGAAVPVAQAKEN